jgi:hypothetical protein
VTPEWLIAANPSTKR